MAAVHTVTSPQILNFLHPESPIQEFPLNRSILLQFNNIKLVMSPAPMQLFQRWSVYSASSGYRQVSKQNPGSDDRQLKIRSWTTNILKKQKKVVLCGYNSTSGMEAGGKCHPSAEVKSQKSALFHPVDSSGSLLTLVENTNVIFFYFLSLFKIKKQNEKYVIRLLLEYIC